MVLDPETVVATEVVVPYYLELRSDGIMYVRITPEKEESVELVKQMVQKMGEMVNYQKVPLLAEHLEFALPPKENREYWATTEACPYSKADAFIVCSTAMKLIANFYLRINKPERPTRMFTSHKEAIEWLRGYL